MEQANATITIDLVSVHQGKYLKFTFDGIFTRRDAELASQQWRAIFNELQNDKIVIVFDCKNMTNYESFARITWQKTILELKDKIDIIWVISDLKLITTGAALIRIFTNLNIKTVKSEREVAILTAA